MSYFDDASLIMIPSGYKTSKVYSVKPTDGTGDLTFTRSNDTATRVASNGLIERVRTNVLTYSNDFSNAAWSPYEYGGASFVRTYGQNDPFGGITAVKFDISVATGGVLFTQNFTTSANAEHGLSVWLKGAVGDEKVQIDLRNTASAGVAGGLLTLTTEWVRYKITANNDSGTSRGFQFRITTSQISGSESFYVYGSQAEIGVPTDYIGPTLAAAVSVGPVANVPRLDYLGSSCPRLLLEPQRTNLFNFSEQIDNAGWTKQNLTITANSAVSPDGYTNADLLDDGTSASTQHWFFQGTTLANSTTYTLSLYAKYVSRQNMIINIFNGASSQYVNYNIQNGTIVGSTGDVTASITSVGNGWYRLTYTRTMAASGGPNHRIGLADDTGSETYTGSNKQTLIYGCQIEAGAYATSYVNTLNSAVTRGVDAASKSGISSLIGQTEGTLYFEFDYKYGQINTDLFEASAGSNDIIRFLALSDFNLRMWMFVGGVQQAAISTVTIPSEGRHKVAMAYKENDCAFYLDGVQIGVDTSCTIPAVDALFLKAPNQDTRQVLVFPTRLSNADLAALTA